MTHTGHLNPRVVDTYSLRTKLYLLGAVMRRMAECRTQGARTLTQFPGTIQVQTRSGCNSHCLLCPQDEVTARFPAAVMDRGLYDRIAREAASHPGLRAFALVLQNEPLLDQDLAAKIRDFQAINAANAIVFIVTNGSLLTPARVHELLASGLDMMHISVNGDQKADFETVNRGRSYDVFASNLEYLLSQDLSRIGVQLSFVANAPFAREQRSAVARYRSMGLRVHVHGISNRGGLVDATLVETFSGTGQADSWRNRLLKPLVKRLLPCCPYPFYQCSILANGQVLLCTHDWARRSIVGDLNSQTIQEVWNGPAITDIRRLFLQGRMKDVPACAGCNVYDSLGFV